MEIVQIKTMGRVNGTIGYVESGAKFEVSMYAPSDPNNPVWTAKIRVLANLTAAPKSAARKMSRNLIEKLVEDGVIK